jgi:hypothetical protein
MIRYLNIDRSKLYLYLSDGWEIDMEFEDFPDRVSISKKFHFRLV